MAARACVVAWESVVARYGHGVCRHGTGAVAGRGPTATTSPTTMTAGGFTSWVRTVSATVARVASTRR